MADKAEKLIADGNADAVKEVIAEVVFVLSGKIYKIGRNAIKTELIGFLNEIGSEDEIIYKALEVYAESKLDFVDCILCAYHRLNGDEICTFDKKLIKELNK
jgi:predicted nucleic-acid-binding protein